MGNKTMQVQSSLLLALTGFTAFLGSSMGAFPQTSSIEQRSEGACSPPIVNNEGHISISCQGVSPEALHFLENQLSEQFGRLNEQLRGLNDAQRTISNLNDLVDNLHKQADGWAQRYHELSARLAENGDSSEQAKQAHELIQKGEFAEAEAILENLATKQEGDVARAAATQFNLGDLAMLRFDPPAALPRYERAYRLETNNYTYALRYGATASNNRDYADAEDALRQALKATDGFPENTTHGVNNAVVFDLLSNVYINTNRLSLAEDAVSKVSLNCKSLSKTDKDYLLCSLMSIDAATDAAG
jgi:tetratricopeptide (TPR) repeat protein